MSVVRARQLRKALTLPEAILWSRLRHFRREHGFHIRRQVPLLGYYLDFACFERRLVIEVDGAHHAERLVDVVRDAALADEGFVTLRFWNSEVTQNLDGVLETILGALRASPPTRPLRGHPPTRGREKARLPSAQGE